MNQKKNLARVLAFCPLSMAFCFMLLACGGVPETFYYTVSNLNAVPNDLNNHQSTHLEIALGVEKFSAETLYEDDRIIYRDSPFEVKYYHYRRWAAPPRALVTDEVLKQLRASSCCREVVSFPFATPVNYVLTGRVLAFEEWDREGKWYGRVALLLQVYEPASRRLLWGEILQAETPATKKVPAAVVEAINASLQKCIADFLKVLPTVVAEK